MTNFTVLQAKPFDAHCRELGSTEEQLKGMGEVIESVQLSTCSRFGQILYSAIIKSKII